MMMMKTDDQSDTRHETVMSHEHISFCFGLREIELAFFIFLNLEHFWST